jgi:hypothetical protein
LKDGTKVDAWGKDCMFGERMCENTGNDWHGRRGRGGAGYNVPVFSGPIKQIFRVGEEPERGGWNQMRVWSERGRGRTRKLFSNQAKTIDMYSVPSFPSRLVGENNMIIHNLHVPLDRPCRFNEYELRYSHTEYLQQVISTGL